MGPEFLATPLILSELLNTTHQLIDTILAIQCLSSILRVGVSGQFADGTSPSATLDTPLG